METRLNFRKALVFVMIIITLILAGIAAFIGWRLSQTDDTTPEDTEAAVVEEGDLCGGQTLPPQEYCNQMECEYPEVAYCTETWEETDGNSRCRCRLASEQNPAIGCTDEPDTCTPPGCPAGYDSCGDSVNGHDTDSGCVRRDDISCQTTCPGCENTTYVYRYCRQEPPTSTPTDVPEICPDYNVQFDDDVPADFWIEGYQLTNLRLTPNSEIMIRCIQNGAIPTRDIDLVIYEPGDSGLAEAEVISDWSTSYTVRRSGVYSVDCIPQNPPEVCANDTFEIFAEPTNTPTNTPRPTATNTPRPTATNTPTPTVGPTSTPTPTPTDGPTSTPTPTPTDGPTLTPTEGPSPTPTDIPSPPKTSLSLDNTIYLIIASLMVFIGAYLIIGTDFINQTGVLTNKIFGGEMKREKIRKRKKEFEDNLD